MRDSRAAVVAESLAPVAEEEPIPNLLGLFEACGEAVTMLQRQEYPKVEGHGDDVERENAQGTTSVEGSEVVFSVFRGDEDGRDEVAGENEKDVDPSVAVPDQRGE